MATQYNATKYNRPTVQGGLALKKQTLSSQVWVDLGTTTVLGDTYYFGKLPKGAVVTGGRIYSGRLVSGVCAASSLVELALGFDQIVANQSGSTFSVASLTSALGHFGPISYATATEGASGTTCKFDSGFTHPFTGILLTNGPLIVTVEGTSVFATVAASGSVTAGSAVSGYLNIELDYYTGTYT